MFKPPYLTYFQNLTTENTEKRLNINGLLEILIPPSVPSMVLLLTTENPNNKSKGKKQIKPNLFSVFLDNQFVI